MTDAFPIRHDGDADLAHVSRILAAENAGGAMGSTMAWTATELMEMDFPEPRWAVPGVVPEGLSLLVGAPKIGKSWLVLSLAIAVASAGRAFGKIPVAAGDVLYLALEDTPRRLRSRLDKALGDEPAPLGLSFATQWPRLPDGGSDQIASWLEEHPRARLVIVDVFARIRGAAPGADMSSYDADYAAMSHLKRLGDKYGVAILVVHHTRKATSEDFLDQVSGTNGLAGSADAVMLLARHRGKCDAALHLTGRDVSEAEYALDFDPIGGRWVMLDGPAGDYQLGDTRAAILELLRRVGESSPKEIAEALQINHETAKKTCQRMLDDGQVMSRRRGCYLPVPGVPESLETSGQLNLASRLPSFVVQES